MPEDSVLARFKRINPSLLLGDEDIGHALLKMFRRATLMKHALEWENPRAGGGRLNSIHGLQWRLPPYPQTQVFDLLQ